MRRELLEVLLRHDEVADLDPPARRLALREALIQENVPGDLSAVLEELTDATDGFGPLQGLIGAPGVTDILINGPDSVWVERAGKLEESSVSFGSQRDLIDFVERLLAQSGARADVSCPIVDGRLKDGSRIHVVMPPLAADGPFVSIRCFPRTAVSLADIERAGGVNPEQRQQLEDAVLERRSIVISGATGSGKTTLLGALLGLVGAEERIVTIEETREIACGAPHVVSLVTRRANQEGTGEVTLADLARSSLRMRPDRIVIGEVRGPEALIALRAMGSGHAGSMLTIHASSARSALSRLTSLALSAAPNLAESSLEREVEDSVDVVVHLERRGGRRAVTELLYL